MNRKKLGMIVMTMTLMLGGSPVLHASAQTESHSIQFTDIADHATYADAVTRLRALGIFNSQNNKFEPQQSVTREQFAKMIVIASNQVERSNTLSGATGIFPDVTKNRWSNGFIQLAVSSGFLNGLSDRKFHPTQAMTFASTVTVLVRMLGYSDQDLKGVWPDNYLNKAADLQLTTGLSISKSAPVPRWVIATLMDRMVTMSVKSGQTSGSGGAGSSGASNATKSFAETVGLFQEAIVLGINGTGEVQTSQGIFQNPSNFQISIGDTIRVKTDHGSIVNVYPTKIKQQSSRVRNLQFPALTLDIDGQSSTYTLLQTSIYYLNGVKVSFEQLKTGLRAEQTFVTGTMAGHTSPDYVVINDPTSESGTYAELVVLDDQLSSAKLESNQIAADSGVFNLANKSIVLEKGYKYGVFVRGDQVQGFYKVLNQVERDTIVQVNGSSLQVKDGNGQAKSMSLPQKTIYYYNGTKQNYDTLKTIFKSGQTIEWGTGTEASSYAYAIIRDPYITGVMSFVEATVLSDSKLNVKLQAKQIQTDQGIYTLLDAAGGVMPGIKYSLAIGANATVISAKPLNESVRGTVLRNTESQLTWISNGNQGSFTLPQSAAYYYNGAKTTYDSLKSIIQANSTIVFGYNANQTGYDYGVVFDPSYSVPQVASATTSSSAQAGLISLNGKTIIRDNGISNVSLIQLNDVVYEVSDINGQNSYIQVYSNRVYGMLTAFLPNALSPQSISADVYNSSLKKSESKTYELSKDFNMSTVTNPAIKVGAYATFLFGVGGKVIDIVN